MEQILAAHEIPCRLVDWGIAPYFGSGSATAVQIQPSDQQRALELLTPLGEDEGDIP